VPVRHGNADHYFRHVRHRYGFTCDDVFSQTFDLTFDLAMFDLFAAWEAGGAVVPVPVTAYRDLGAFVRGRGITAWFSTPSTIGLAARLGGLRPASMPSLRWSLFCGEPLVVDDVARWLRAAPGSVVENLYGPTEATISCAVHRWSSRSAREAVNGVVPIGRLHRGLDHLVVDAHGDPAETGELCLAGPQVFDGYLDPADDEGRFLHRGSRRWYRTGDRVGRTARGELAFLGRVDDQVQVRGWRVEPGEIEHRLRDRPEVDSAVVVAPHVDGGRTLVAFYTGVPCADAVLAGHLARDLPRTLMPDRYVHVEDLPRNANDKVDRRALEARASALLADRADDHRHHPPEEDS
jgi:non-ribosomal peptide synthetase component F